MMMTNEKKNFEERVRKLSGEIDAYRQAIRDARDALDAAERELEGALSDSLISAPDLCNELIDGGEAE